MLKDSKVAMLVSSTQDEIGMYTIEQISKIAALVFALTYVCGFLVVSIHNASFGFSDMKLMRLRVMSAGAWFLVMTGLPCFVITHFFSDSKELLFKQMLIFFLSCIIGGWAFFGIFTSKDIKQDSKWVIKGIVTALSLGLVMGLALVLTKRSSHADLLCLAILVVLFIVVAFLPLFEPVKIRTITVWFFAIGAGLKYVMGIHESYTPMLAFESLMILLAFLLVFSLFFYKDLEPSFGGGSPPPIVVMFNKQSESLFGSRVAGGLISESDQGYYFLVNGEKKAIFIPRTSVSLVYYGAAFNTSKLLDSTGIGKGIGTL